MQRMKKFFLFGCLSFVKRFPARTAILESLFIKMDLIGGRKTSCSPLMILPEQKKKVPHSMRRTLKDTADEKPIPNGYRLQLFSSSSKLSPSAVLIKPSDLIRRLFLDDDDFSFFIIPSVVVVFYRCSSSRANQLPPGETNSKNAARQQCRAALFIFIYFFIILTDRKCLVAYDS